MRLYIQVQDGQPINHPAFEDNLIQAFGKIPDDWEAFVRVEKPIAGVYQVFDSEEPIYQKIDGVWTDVWQIHEISDEEKSIKQQAVIAEFNNREQLENWSAWALDEATCTMQPPIPRPNIVEGIDIRWCGADNAWKEVPSRPVDGQYKFDFIAWNWVAI